MGSRLLGVSVVKNEADIIEASVRHNLRYLDRLLVLDHGSSDATPRILDALAAEGLPLDVSRLAAPDPSFKQAQITTGLARRAFDECGADHVVPLDADEFLHVPSRADLDAALLRSDSAVCSLHWQTYVPSADDAARHDGSAHPLRMLRWRVETAKPALPKVVISRRILRTNWQIGRGNHVVYDQTHDGLHWDAGTPLADMNLAHLPLRSPQQLVAKVLVGWLSRKLTYGLNAETTTNSWHLRELFRRIVGGEPITAADVRDYAIAVYALGNKPGAPDAGAYRLVEAHFDELPPLRYTSQASVDPARALAAWSEQLIDDIMRSAGATASRGSPPAG